jgi:hypothetical protein
MAATKIADVIVPEVFNSYVQERIPELSLLWTSGIVASVPGLDILGSRGGTTIAMPFWHDLDGEEEILSDTTPLGVDKIDAGQDIAVLHTRGKAWGVNDLAKALAGDDPMEAIGDLVATYWARRYQVQLLATLQGVFAAASMSGNVLDISGESGDAGVIGGDTLTDALYVLGDMNARLTALAMHSRSMKKLVKNDLIEFLRDSEGNPTIPVYMGKRVLVDDTMPASTEVLTTYLFGEGAFGFGEGNAPVPTETDRDSLQGEDILINRRHYVLHPRGGKWVGDPSGVSPTNVELRVGSNWTRVWDRRNIRMVQFKHRVE